MRFIIYALLTLSFSSAFANEGLKVIMKDLSTNYSKLTKSVKVPDSNSDSLATIKEIQSLIQKAEKETPDKVSQLPADEQQKAIDEYQSLLSTLNSHFDVAGYALTKNNNTLAASVVTGASEVIKDGHKIFK